MNTNQIVGFEIIKIYNTSIFLPWIDYNMTYIVLKIKKLNLSFTKNYDAILGIFQKILQKLISRGFVLP